jgi:hypothetical protein
MVNHSTSLCLRRASLLSSFGDRHGEGNALGGSAMTLDDPDEHATDRARMAQAGAPFTAIESSVADRAHRWLEEPPGVARLRVARSW